jgi:hypothetical protein
MNRGHRPLFYSARASVSLGELERRCHR